MKITKRRTGDVLVLAPEGKMAIGAGDNLVRDAIREALAGGERKLLLDMKKVTMLDSSGVGDLVGGYTSAVKRNCAFKLAQLGPRVREALSVTQLTGVFEIFDDEASALESFSSSRKT